MKRIGWAIALAAAGLTPAAAQAPQTQEVAGPAATAPSERAQGQSLDAANAPAPSTPSTSNPEAAQSTATIPTALPDKAIGHPNGFKGIQTQVTEIGREAAAFHNIWLLGLCVIISFFVLGLLGYTMIRYRRSANPVPSRNSHNTTIEVVWTLVPVLILVAIAIPSMRLLQKQYSPPKADLTVKVVGNQWFWTYQYPDNGDFEIVSNMLKEKADVKPGDRFRTDADGPPLLAVDERLVIPAGKVVKFLVTSNDVIHSFAIPAFWDKIDANPGSNNETWVKVDRPGVYFGQCSELCGARHAYMPIAVEVVPPAQFAAWVASKGGTMPGASPQPVAAAAPAAAGARADAAAAPAEAQPNVANRATAND
ncbi:MAG TPA: cytochrome c oxidase subunit II [Sphingomicrobium sp.]|nr:cytochrome c oxidase subunit II [Sphingomicrobium sp.]